MCTIERYLKKRNEQQSSFRILHVLRNLDFLQTCFSRECHIHWLIKISLFQAFRYGKLCKEKAALLQLT